MSRTKQEVRDFLNSQVGQRVNAKAGVYSGQCVSLIKALMEFLGDIPNPYGARGNAIDVGDTLLRQGIANNGTGWLNVVVNRDMGRIYENGRWNNYGHIWIDVNNEFNIEQNGAKALYTTKNTRPIQQGQQIVNLDKYIRADAPAKPNPPKEDNMPVKVNIEIARLLSWGLEMRIGALRRVLGREHKSAVDGVYDAGLQWMIGQPLDLPLLQKIYGQKFVNDKRLELTKLADDMDELRKAYPGGPKEWLELLNSFKEGANAEQIEAINKISKIIKDLNNKEK